jgi:Flp pilus assembly protein TadG
MGPQGKGLGRRGATAVFVGVALAALLGMVSLAVDVGMLMKWRSDAQRAADAAALAGAQEFRDATPAVAKGPAADSAIAYAARNYVGWRGIDTSGKIFSDSGNNRLVNSPEAYVQVLTDQRKVRVFIRRAQNPTWFGKLLGWDFVPISVKAAAQVSTSGTGKCVKPFAIPDLWAELGSAGKKGGTGPSQDVNNNRVWDPSEAWQYEPPADRYAAYNPDTTLAAQALQTGYGSTWRNSNGLGVTNDYGLQITIKPQSPHDNITSGWFYPWRMDFADGTEAKGANDYRSLLSDTTCTLAAPVQLGQTFDVEDGNMVGPTKQAINDLMSYDPGAHWDPTFPDGLGHTGAVRGSKYADWRDSPRVIVLSLFDPAQIANIQSGGSLNIQFNNLALFFLEGMVGSGNQAPVQGRFLYFVHSSGPSGPVAGSLIKKLQLVE